MKKKGMHIGAAIGIGIGGMFLIAIEWVLVVIIGGALAIGTFKGKTGGIDFDIEDYDFSGEYDDYEVYENSTLGIKFRYPERFTESKEETEGGYTTVLFYNPETGESVNLVTGDTTGVFTFDAYEKASISSLKNSYNLTDDDIEIDDKGVTMGGKKGFKNYYVYSGVGIYQCATLKGVTEYVLTYSGPEGIFEKSEGDKIFETFEFIESSSSTSNSTKKSSSVGTSKENAVDVGEWTVASKYNPNTSGYQDVKVKVTNIVRGDEAKKIVKEYADSDKYFNYEEPEDAMEWVVIEYDVDMDGIEIPSYGISPTVNVNVVGTDKYDSIKYNGKAYSTLTYEVSSNDYVKTSTASNKVAATLPVGYTDYLIKFGNYNETISYVKGK